MCLLQIAENKAISPPVCSGSKKNKSQLLQLAFILVFLVFSNDTNAQNNSQVLTHEPQIIEYLGNEKFLSIQESNPSYLSFLNARCEGYLVMEYVEEKMHDFEIIKKIPRWNSELQKLESVTPEEFILDLESNSFNFLKYKFKFDKSNLTYFVIGETGKVIMIYPVEQINKMVNSTN